jgi:hypothetical protein
MSKHTACKRGKRVRLIFHDGSVLITKFIKRDEQHKIHTEAGVFGKGDFRSFGVYKPLPHER